MALRAEPYFQPGGGMRLMLIGQDPTIRKRPERVRKALMLDDPNTQLSRWLRNIFGVHRFDTLTVYATNLVKCTFAKPPSDSAGGGLKFLKPYFQNCKEHLARELLAFKPEFVLTLGEPAHKLFVSTLDGHSSIPDSMNAAFTGRFIKAEFCSFQFDYTPCLHIQNFRVAESYGDKVKTFKQGISAYLDADSTSPCDEGSGG
jgi:uracil-DNA glycosylase